MTGTKCEIEIVPCRKPKSENRSCRFCKIYLEYKLHTLIKKLCMLVC